MTPLKIRERLRANIIAQQATIHLQFVRQQLLLDLHSTLDGKLAHPKFFLQI